MAFSSPEQHISKEARRPDTEWKECFLLSPRAVFLTLPHNLSSHLLEHLCQGCFITRISCFVCSALSDTSSQDYYCSVCFRNSAFAFKWFATTCSFFFQRKPEKQWYAVRFLYYFFLTSNQQPWFTSVYIAVPLKLKLLHFFSPLADPLNQALAASSYTSMSYENSKSTPSSSTRGRMAGGDGKDQEAEFQGLIVQKNISGQLGVTQKDQRNGAGGGSPPSEGSQGSSGDQRGPTSDDMDGISSGNDSGERESEGGMERENRSHGHQSARSFHSSSNGKDSGMILETTESNKR